ncbi:expressed unknown protein [Seminavis robusta]|uniref:Uncharacterized protein n=1 Tax=Seminavis robusta TaxID=568900 RepID=A0A9N8EX54_9STRA|nr:expressed unknown protein [Seminavis robusta]|eukprot:Sro2120_g315380.1 n/a (324) ;mRNA; r:290-1261
MIDSIDSSASTPSNISSSSQAIITNTSTTTHLPVDHTVWTGFWSDFDPHQGGDGKIVRALGRTALVNLVVTVTGGGGIAGYLAGGAITANRVGTGLHTQNSKEVVKGLAVFGSATTASVVGQVVTGAIMVGVAGASLPVAGVVAFGVGCTSGITAGALSEWGVDSAWVEDDQNKENDIDKKSMEDTDDTSSTTAEDDSSFFSGSDFGDDKDDEYKCQGQEDSHSIGSSSSSDSSTFDNVFWLWNRKVPVGTKPQDDVGHQRQQVPPHIVECNCLPAKHEEGLFGAVSNMFSGLGSFLEDRHKTFQNNVVTITEVVTNQREIAN